MKPRTIAIIVLIVVFLVGISYALLREVKREEERLVSSLNGIVEVDVRLYAEGLVDIVKTDRLVLYLVDPASGKPMALNILNPLVPPQVFQIGQEHHLEGAKLKGKYLLVGITDKDGEVFKVTPGEVYGRSAEPIALGTEQIRLVLNEPFRGNLFNRVGISEARAASPVRSSGGGSGEGRPDPTLTIRGTLRVAEALRAGVEPSDRLVILLMDPVSKRPIATKIIPHVLIPQTFSISAPPGNAGKSFYLRILTDKDGQPVNAVEGEVIGRSGVPVPLGTTDLDFVLDQPFRR